jgi:Fic family protein
MSADAGSYRQEPWAIFDQSGNAIYLAPMHFEVPKLMDEYISYIAAIDEHPAVIAAIAQFVFEKIHPFPDGNGRVGRLISALILSQRGYGLKGLVPFEKYLDLHKSEYYRSLENSSNPTEFIHFFLNALTNEIDEIIFSLETATVNSEELLLPRRKEILNIIRDHPMCSFDQIRRRFLAVNPKTLHYDLAQLIKSGLVKKIGATRGALYQSVK